MISLAGRDILHGWGKFALTGVGLGLLIGVTLSMAGIYRGMVDDAQALLANSGADLWVVQKDTQGPYAEASSIKDDVVRSVRGMPGVGQAANVTYLTQQVQKVGGDEVRVMVVGIEPGQPGEPGYLVAGRQLTRNHYEAVVDVKTGLSSVKTLIVRRHELQGGGGDAAHGVLRWRPDGVYPAQRCARGAVFERQRHHPQRPPAHRRQPGL